MIQKRESKERVENIIHFLVLILEGSLSRCLTITQTKAHGGDKIMLFVLENFQIFKKSYVEITKFLIHSFLEDVLVLLLFICYSIPVVESDKPTINFRAWKKRILFFSICAATSRFNNVKFGLQLN